ncbi:putative Ntn-hydrolase superfamily protein [Angulomicrobium tetraedrale]|uniref:Putative Ntn-hydrolase superfamily protein n=1 Tax=Ancylobacter tetraedralis TaxID=217068 RepID=A0A839Z4D2_9HYPH|nr:DUF1028 domain-containing protein [Ancylobacter tetraedralis]MBB3770482.1 putative Ntn-hydrolase superfamily protein [Ancylobacter tetraedralis]
MTFSIVARCPTSFRLGVAVATAVPAVGSMCPFVRAGVGAVSTQSWVNPYLALDGLERLARGQSAPEALAAVMAQDDGRELRQIGMVDAMGRVAAWSGTECTPWFGHEVGDGFTVQGNMLTGPEVIAAMAAAYRASEGAPLDERLMRALEAGDAAGGDRRGRQSASLCVYSTEFYPALDVRVDEHAAPVAELRRVLEIARLQLVPFVDGMPRRGGSPGPAPAAVTAMLALPPPARPGGGGSGPA